MLAAFLTTLLFSLSAVCGNRTSKLLGGTEANFWRLCFAAILLGSYAYGWGGGLNGSALPLFLVSGLIGFGVGDMALFQALPRLGSRLSVMLTLCLSSPIAAAMEWVWLRTELTSAEIICATVILAGVALALAPGQERLVLKGSLATGLSFGLLASLCQAAGAVLSRKAYLVARLAGENMDGITAAFQRILGGIGFGVLVLMVVKRDALRHSILPRSEIPSESKSDRAQRWRDAWPWVLANGLAGPALGVSCYQWALQTTPTGVVLPIVAITPLVIIPFSYRLEGERPTRRSLAGGLVAVIGAVALALLKNPRH